MQKSNIDVKITVTGLKASGKTRILHIIEAVLESIDLEVNFERNASGDDYGHCIVVRGKL